MGGNLPFFFREVSQSLRRNVMLNIASTATVFVLTVLLGFFMLSIDNINNISLEIMKTLHIRVVLEDDLSMEKAGQLKHRILKLPDVEMVRYISREQGFEQLKKTLKDKVDLRNLTTNPLPNVLDVEVKHPDKIPDVAGEIKKYPGIEKKDGVKYGDKKVVDSLIKLSRFLYISGSIVIGVLLLSSIFLISNTIRLTVFSRRKEIAIMELVGAAQWFIRGPFLIEGLLHGIVGSGCAIILLNMFYSWFTQWIFEYMKFIPVRTSVEVLPNVSLILLAVGMVVGSVSSYFSVNKYLKI